MTNHGNMTDHLSQEWAPHVIAHVDFTRMTPATHGVDRGVLAPLADYLGGRLHGQITMSGFHDLLRDELGHNINGRSIPDRYYRLYRGGVCLHYVHSTLIGDHAERPPVAG